MKKKTVRQFELNSHFSYNFRQLIPLQQLTK